MLEQAVILAGGRGTRMAPFTDTMPKPMVRVHGKPFLEYLVEMLREAGITRVVLLLGYMPEVIQEYFGDGRRWGLEISYSVSPVEDETGTRVRNGLPLYDPVFLLMYCDNYWPLLLGRMWEKFSTSNAAAMVTVYSNADKSTKDNLVVDENGYVTVYDKSRKRPGLKGVDIGFLILRKDTLGLLSDDNVSFEATLYPQLIERRELLAFLSAHKYYSIGSPDRLPLTERFLARVPTVFLDRDGVLNRKMPRAEYVRSWNDWQWLPGVRDAVARLSRAGFRIIVITNQAGIARGVMTEQELHRIHDRMKAELHEAGAKVDAIYYCPHGWDDGCDCRKPRPGMLLQAQKEFHLDLTRTYLVGDDDRDGEAAAAAGCHFLKATEETPLTVLVERLLDPRGVEQHTHVQQ